MWMGNAIYIGRFPDQIYIPNTLTTAVRGFKLKFSPLRIDIYHRYLCSYDARQTVPALPNDV